MTATYYGHEYVAILASTSPASGSGYCPSVCTILRAGSRFLPPIFARLSALGVKTVNEMKQYKYGPDFLHPEFKKFVQQYLLPAGGVGEHR